MTLSTFVQYDVNIFAALLLVIILAAMYSRRDSFHFSARLFQAMILVNVLMLVLEILSWHFDRRPGVVSRQLNYAVNWVFLWLSPLIVPLWASYIDFRIHGSRERLRRRLYYMHPMIVSTALLVGTLFEPLVFEIGPDNVYSRGPFMWVNLAVTYAMLLYIVHMAARRRHEVQSRLISVILLFTAIPAVGALVQMLVLGVLTIWPLMATVIVLTYVFLENYDASIDHLTGLFNRIRVDEYVHSLMDGRQRFGIIVVDLDDFKGVNDNHGHHQGDQVLMMFSKAMREVFRDERMLARFGGDEFLVVTRSSDDADIAGLEDRLARRVAELGRQAGHPFDITFSYGYALYDPASGRSYEDLFITADQQMYMRKRANKRLHRRADDPPAYTS
ncbi:MAG: diguanylate cyclase domain-containing protein [Spirochaetota bacterium]